MAVAGERADEGPLIERDRERSGLAGAIEGALAGEGAVVLLEGPAGIGKTRLLGEAVSLAEEMDVRALTARATELERDFAFGVARQLFVPPLHLAGDGERERLLAGAAALAEGALETGMTNAAWLPTPDSAFSYLHGLYWLLANLAEEGPVVLGIDDLQWADEPSLRLAAFLAPRIGELGVALIATVRSGEPDSPDEVLGRLAVDAAATTLRPKPLSERGSTELLESLLDIDLDAGTAEAARDSAAGNPLLLRLLGRELAERGPADAAQIRGLAPRSVIDTALARLNSLGSEARSLAEGIAISGERTSLDLAAGLADIELETAAEVADALQRAGLLRTGGLSFEHPMIRNAVQESLGPRRLLLHRRAADQLLELGAEPERVAAHLLASEPAGNPAHAAVLREAAREAVRRGGPALAVQYLDRALAEPPGEGDRAAIHYELGAAGARAGFPRAEADLEAAFEGATDPAIRAMAALELGQARAYAGELADAARIGSDALVALSGESERSYSRAVEMMLLVLATTDLAVRDDSRQLMAAAHETVARLGAEAPLGLLAFAAFDDAVRGRAAQPTAELAAAALADGRILDEQGPEAPHATGAALALALSGREAEGEAALDMILDAARARGSTRGYAWAGSMRAWLRWRTGDLAGAEADARACLEVERGHGWELFLPMARAALAGTLIELGRLEEAGAQIAEAEAQDPAPGAVFSQPLREAAARAALAGGDGELALERLGPASAWAEAWGAADGHWVRGREVSALALAGTDGDRAIAVARDELELAEGHGAAARRAAARRCLGTLLDDDEGREQLEAAIELCHPRSLEHGRAAIELGASLRRAGRRKEARESLREGLDVAVDLGAKALAARAREELEASGARLSRDRTSGAEGLTARERQVAERVAAGESNPEVAQALFISRKTVETHLRAVFRKLDVDSREEVEGALKSGPAGG